MHNRFYDITRQKLRICDSLIATLKPGTFLAGCHDGRGIPSMLFVGQSWYSASHESLVGHESYLSTGRPVNSTGAVGVPLAHPSLKRLLLLQSRYDTMGSRRSRVNVHNSLAGTTVVEPYLLSDASGDERKR